MCRLAGACAVLPTSSVVTGEAVGHRNVVDGDLSRDSIDDFLHQPGHLEGSYGEGDDLLVGHIGRGRDDLPEPLHLSLAVENSLALLGHHEPAQVRRLFRGLVRREGYARHYLIVYENLHGILRGVWTR